MEKLDAKEGPNRVPMFVSLGMAVIDELNFPMKEALVDVPGGSATLGARLVQTPARSTSVAYVLLAGYDFPEAVSCLLQEWRIRLHVHKMPNHPSTRGLLVYEDDAFGRKSFVYTTPPLQPRPSNLEVFSLLEANSFHFLSTPKDLESQLTELLELRKKHGVNGRPLIVWEPAPLGCDRHNLDAHLRACKLVDVFSPNHLELGYLVQSRNGHDPTAFSKSTVESFAHIFLTSGVGQKGGGCAVIRAGEHGALTLSASFGPEWLPPFYSTTSPKVVDPTGAGNTFLGAFCATLQETGDPREASIRGTVAAGYALEQFGLPRFSPASSDSEESWNGSSFSARIGEFRKRLSTESTM